VEVLFERVLLMLGQYEKAAGDDDLSLKLVGSIEQNTKHYVDIFSSAVDKVMPKETRAMT
jgi:DNA replication licensing factor MCM7